MDEDYPIPDMETIFHNLYGASNFGKIDLSDAYYQIEIDEEAKDIRTINTSQGLFKMCRPHQGLKNSSSIFQEGHAVIYVSRKLTPAEQNYSSIEREALAIVFVVTRLKQFLPGRRFTLQNDHKPLKYLFAPDEEIPKTEITRWAIALMGFDYEFKYTPGEQIPH